ncbi:Hint domain-containing protein [Mesorhizobium sp. LHD-90]|uniref:Hint domain-containing protein n=1 Tax=Mesorhizobium sp. LHD-90 TaxID=3071414 RepID=UPI0027E1A2E0|nr:Hint domain-containing protein [Mesorhizobium sp. LHD-90]MDQ6432794.1 Hint domain-containing protein [Mesorhizobium sp. LHD-90]
MDGPVGGVPAGTVVQVTDVGVGAAPAGTANIGTTANVDIAPTSGGLNAVSETLYAYTGSPDAPDTFLAAVSNDGFSATSGGLTGTGLVAGETAVDLGAVNQGADLGVYDPSTAGTNFADRDTTLAALNNSGNWATQDATGDQSNDGIAPEGDFLNDPESPLNGVSFTVCYLPGTMIGTPSGEASVESLAIGDLVRTVDGRSVPVKWIGRQTLSMRFGMPDGRRPVRIAAGALGEGLPTRDLRLTSTHALLIDGVLVHAGALVNGMTIRRIPDDELGERFVVYHIETENHEIVLAQGTPAESFIDNVSRRWFDNHAEYEALYGAAPIAMEELRQPRAMSSRQVPPSIKARIAVVAGSLLPAHKRGA